MTKKHMTFRDREKLEELYLDGCKVEKIACDLGVHRATVYTELRRGYTGEMDSNGNPRYSAALAQQKIFENRVRRFGSKEVAAENAT